MKKFNLCLCLVLLAGCARNPVTGKREIVLVSESQEAAMGAQSNPQVREQYGFAPDANVQRYVQAMGNKLAAVSHRPGLEWHFTVVDSPVVNAFAIPGGYIYVTRGILAYLNNEAELAGVVGHEIGHVTARHSVRQITRQQLAQIGIGVGGALSPAFGQFSNLAGSSLGLLFLRFSRDDERQSDRLGVEYAARAGYDPREVSHFFDVLGRLSDAGDRQTIPGWLSTHPDPPERVKVTGELGEEWIRTLGLAPDRLLVGRDPHYQAINNLAYGDNPRDGYVAEGHFYHPELRFQIQFPGGWHIENTRQAVFAVDPRQAAEIQLTVAPAPDGTTAEAYVQQLASRGLRPQSSAGINVNGYHGVMALYSIPAEGGTLAAIAAFIEYGSKLFQVVGTTGDYRSYRNVIEDSIRTFDRLSDPKILNVQPDRLKIYTAKQGDTLAAIAERLNNPRVSADQLGILNRMAISQPIAPGRLVKTVERGY